MAFFSPFFHHLAPWLIKTYKHRNPCSILCPCVHRYFLVWKSEAQRYSYQQGLVGFCGDFHPETSSHTPLETTSHIIDLRVNILYFKISKKNNYSNIFNQNLVLDGGRVFSKKNALPVKRERSGSHCVRSPSLLQVTLHAQSPPASFRASVEISGWLQWLSRWIWWGYDGDRVYIWSKPPNPGCQRKVKV